MSFVCDICGKERNPKTDKGFETDICGDCIKAYKNAASLRSEVERLRKAARHARKMSVGVYFDIPEYARAMETIRKDLDNALTAEALTESEEE